MKTILTIVLSAGLLATTGSELAAAPCTDEYVKCLNDSADWNFAARLLADIVCFDDYTACVYWGIIAT